LSVLGASDDLMPEHNREPGRLDLVVAQMEVGPAHPAGAHPEFELPRLRGGVGEGRGLERFALAFEDGGAHVML
jgi:hypothetical protein